MKGIIIGLAVTIGLLGANYFEYHYNRNNCEVVAVQGDAVTCVDECGYEWEFYGEGFAVGDKVNLKMYDNGTESIIKDDKIVNVERAGE